MMRIATVTLLSILLVSACGWRLRGTLALPEGLDQVYLNNQTGSQILSRTLEELLVANNVTLVDKPSTAQLVINLLTYREDRRVLSIGANTRVTEYELIAEAGFSMEDAEGNLVLPPSDASSIRAYEFDQDDVLGKAQEEQLIQQEMRRDVAQQIIRRLRFLKLGNEANVPATAAP